MTAEAIRRFECFGGACGAYVEGDVDGETAARAATRAQATLLEWHLRFSRFIAGSELSRLNADSREEVPVSPLMARLAATAREAAERTGGLVDATLGPELARGGYEHDLPPALPLELALALAPARRPAGAAGGESGRPSVPWQKIEADDDACVVRRPAGLALDSGGLAKGLFADELAATLAAHRSFAIDCAGDLVLGGASGVERAIEVESPFDRSVLHSFELTEGGVATSGIGRRSWLGADGRPWHHLLDPATGRPAFTGIVQATALAPTALLAEIHAKAALLSGPGAAPGWLPWGGLLVFDDGSARVLEPADARIAAEAPDTALPV